MIQIGNGTCGKHWLRKDCIRKGEASYCCLPTHTHTHINSIRMHSGKNKWSTQTSLFLVQATHLY